MLNEQLEVNISAAKTELTDEMRADLAQYFADASPDYIRGYLQGVRDNSEAMIGEAFLSVQATIPMQEYLKEITASGE